MSTSEKTNKSSSSKSTFQNSLGEIFVAEVARIYWDDIRLRHFGADPNEPGGSSFMPDYIEEKFTSADGRLLKTRLFKLHRLPSKKQSDGKMKDVSYYEEIRMDLGIRVERLPITKVTDPRVLATLALFESYMRIPTKEEVDAYLGIEQPSGNGQIIDDSNDID